MMGNKIRMPFNRCPHCGYKTDAATAVNEAETRAPEPGDFSVCFGCGEINKFDDHMALIKVSATTLATADEDVRDELFLAQTSVRLFLAKQ
jgi:hypothetical protein